MLVDTDGDFSKIISNFIDAGVDGFLPIVVNAGMDIVAVRRQFPNLKFIGRRLARSRSMRSSAEFCRWYDRAGISLVPTTKSH